MRAHTWCKGPERRSAPLCVPGTCCTLPQRHGTSPGALQTQAGLCANKTLLNISSRGQVSRGLPGRGLLTQGRVDGPKHTRHVSLSCTHGCDIPNSGAEAHPCLLPLCTAPGLGTQNPYFPSGVRGPQGLAISKEHRPVLRSPETEESLCFPLVVLPWSRKTSFLFFCKDAVLGVPYLRRDSCAHVPFRLRVLCSKSPSGPSFTMRPTPGT